MLTKEQVLSAIAAGKENKTLDGRDLTRLLDFFPADQWHLFGASVREGATPPPPAAWTEANVKQRLALDVEFAFEKALGRRGISAGMMFHVLKMWMWVLEGDLQYFPEDNYPKYGLPLIKAVAVKYGFPNEIGDDTGSEYDYDNY